MLVRWVIHPKQSAYYIEDCRILALNYSAGKKKRVFLEKNHSGTPCWWKMASTNRVVWKNAPQNCMTLSWDFFPTWDNLELKNSFTKWNLFDPSNSDLIHSLEFIYCKFLENGLLFIVLEKNLYLILAGLAG